MAAVQTAYLLKESFEQRWGHAREGWARRFFDNSLGFVESVNTKIRVIQRRAYGLRDEEYLLLKVLTCMLPEMLGHHSI